MATGPGMYVHLEELNQLSLMKQMPVTSSHQGHVNVKRYLKFFSGRAIITKYEQNDYNYYIITNLNG